MSPPTDAMLLFITPFSSSKTRSPITFLTSQSASSLVSAAPIPIRMRYPLPMEDFIWLSMDTEALATRCNTILMDGLCFDSFCKYTNFYQIIVFIVVSFFLLQRVIALPLLAALPGPVVCRDVMMFLILSGVCFFGIYGDVIFFIYLIVNHFVIFLGIDGE